MTSTEGVATLARKVRTTPSGRKAAAGGSRAAGISIPAMGNPCGTTALTFRFLDYTSMRIISVDEFARVPLTFQETRLRPHVPGYA